MGVGGEESELGLENGVEYGVEGFERDVGLSEDGKLIVFHDAVVDGSSNG
ncbi:glycerophosphodiester phosphodiesterase family protein [Staphylococcus capitis]|nr:glycerophosphodiester phosphodiesterase family protein [Staphylococcus capitis]